VLKQAKPEIERHRKLAEWQAAKVDWLAELNELAARLPETHHAFVERLQAVASDKQQGNSIKLTARARDESMLTAMTALSVNKHYEVEPGAAVPQQSKTDFKQEYEYLVTLKPTPSDTPRPVPTDLAKTKQRRTPTGFGTPKPVEVAKAPDSARPARGASTPTSTPSGSATPTAAAPAGDAETNMAAKLAKLVALPYEEREKEFNKMNAFMQRVWRKKVEQELKKGGK
jgi:hypothetical protein